MNIFLMRHGQPEVPRREDRINSAGFPDCLKIYNSCGLSLHSKPEAHTLNKFKDFRAVVASDFKRSIESALRLSFPQPLIYVDPLFREVQDVFLRIPFLKLKPRTWSKVFICLWYIGLFRYKASVREGRHRAKQCAKKLIELAETHQSVLFVGHGFLNAYIARELSAQGWKGPKMPSKRYWEYGAYQPEAS